MKKIYLFIIIIFLLSGCALTNRPEAKIPPDKTVKINGQEIKVEIANTPESQYLGLSFRKELCADCGMLFVFNNRRERTFVMRNMNFSLDIIFIDGERIVKIHKNLPPEGMEPKNFYSSGSPVDYVMEVNGGFTDKYRIKDNDIINFFKIKRSLF